MATKKTPTKAPVTAGATTTPTPRPFADSTAPEHCRVNPESALTIVAESKLPPNAPKPVYSTLALANGRDAFGAAHVRPDFAWNPQMDLLWALGYPYCVILVDSGVPLALMAEQLQLWTPLAISRLSFNIFRGIEPVPRPLAAAHLWALRAGKIVERLTEEEWPEAVAFTPELADIATILGTMYPGHSIRKAAFVLEAFLGPEPVLEVLLDLAEKHLLPDHSERSEAAMSAIAPMLLRATLASRKHAHHRIETIRAAAGKAVAEYADYVLTPVEVARQDPEYGTGPLSFHFDCEALMLECLRADSPGDVPQTRLIFPGGLGVAKLECARLKKYDQQDLVEAYLRDYSTTFRAGMLPGLLTCLSKKDARANLLLWFEAHRERLHPELVNLSADPESGELATKGLKTLRW